MHIIFLWFVFKEIFNWWDSSTDWKMGKKFKIHGEFIQFSFSVVLLLFSKHVQLIFKFPIVCKWCSLFGSIAVFTQILFSLSLDYDMSFIHVDIYHFTIFGGLYILPFQFMNNLLDFILSNMRGPHTILLQTQINWTENGNRICLLNAESIPIHIQCVLHTISSASRITIVQIFSKLRKKYGKSCCCCIGNKWCEMNCRLMFKRHRNSSKNLSNV